MTSSGGHEAARNPYCTDPRNHLIAEIAGADAETAERLGYGHGCRQVEEDF